MADPPSPATERGPVTRLLLPSDVDSSAVPLVAARALRALTDGPMAVLLPAYLWSIGLGTLQVAIAATATLLGSALATLATLVVGAWGHRFAPGHLLQGAASLMAATGAGFAGLASCLGPSRRIVVRSQPCSVSMPSQAAWA